MIQFLRDRLWWGLPLPPPPGVAVILRYCCRVFFRQKEEKGKDKKDKEERNRKSYHLVLIVQSYKLWDFASKPVQTPVSLEREEERESTGVSEKPEAEQM